MTETQGALVIGGDLNALSIARSLGRQGIPVWIVSTPNIRLAGSSRYTQKTFSWPDDDGERQAAYLLDLAERHQLNKWVLFPTSDETAALLARFHTTLSPRFRVSTPTWDVLRWAYDKRLTYQLAAEQNIDFPATFYPKDADDLKSANLNFPAILKPATHKTASRFTADKAWPAATQEELVPLYLKARELIPPDLILVQERIPGGGEAQFSFAALCRDGELIAFLTARRTRQYPVDFGYSSSFVETLDVPEIVRPSRQLIRATRYTGLVEIEYKLDRRDGGFKLLDINPRLWTWASLGARAGTDFPYLLWRMLVGEHVRKRTARTGVRWVRMSTDIPAALHDIFRGRLGLREYLRSLCGPIEFALMAADDPLPGMLDIPMYFFKHFYNAYESFRSFVRRNRERGDSVSTEVPNRPAVFHRESK